MQKRKILHLFLGFSIMLQAAFFQLALPNLVLCIGEDGHVAFEWRTQDKPEHHKDGALPNLFVHNQNKNSDSGNVNCTDINLHFHPSQAEKTQKQNIAKITINLFCDFKLSNQEKMNRPVSLKTIQPFQLSPTIGTEHSSVLII